MLCTLYTNNESVYINPNAIAFVAKEYIRNEKAGIQESFSRVYLRDLNLPEDVPCWVDVKESVLEIAAGIRHR